MKKKINLPFQLNRNTLYWIAGSIVVYLFFLLLYLPASVALSMLSLPPGIHLSGISGTAWSGQASYVSIRGVQAGSLKWKLSPWSFLLANPTAKISILKDKQFILTTASVSFAGKTSLQDTRFNIQLSTLQPLIYGMPFAYDGQVAGFFSDIYFSRDQYIGINGKLSLSGLKLTSPQQQYLGNYIATFRQEQAGASSIEVSTTEAELKIDAKIVLEKNGLARISAELAAASPGNAIDKMISMLGKKDSQGRVMLRQQFKLW